MKNAPANGFNSDGFAGNTKLLAQSKPHKAVSQEQS